jgi:uncharacterized protein YutE (UPF0331/DUF86 family)
VPRELNLEKIKTLEKDLLDAVSEIRALLAGEAETFVRDQKAIYSLRYLLIETVEVMANICNHILARTTGQVPKGYPDCFEKLADGGTLTKELSVKLKKMASLRNILIHRYWQIDDRRIFQSVKDNLGDVEEFLRQINKVVKEPR